MTHNLEIRICKDMTLQEVELLKDFIYECIMSACEVDPELEKLGFELLPEQVDLIVTDSQ